MNTKFYLTAAFLGLTLGPIVSPPAFTEEPSRSWIRERCAAYRGGHCRVPFVVVLSFPNELSASKDRIQVRGYLVHEDYGFALYQDRESAKRGWRSDAIRIRATSNSLIEDSLVHWNERLVQIRGRVLLETPDDSEYWVAFELDAPAFVAGIRGEMLKK